MAGLPVHELEDGHLARNHLRNTLWGSGRQIRATGAAPYIYSITGSSPEISRLGGTPRWFAEEENQQDPNLTGEPLPTGARPRPGPGPGTGSRGPTARTRPNSSNWGRRWPEPPRWISEEENQQDSNLTGSRSRPRPGPLPAPPSHPSPLGAPLTAPHSPNPLPPPPIPPPRSPRNIP